MEWKKTLHPRQTIGEQRIGCAVGFAEGIPVERENRVPHLIEDPSIETPPQASFKETFPKPGQPQFTVPFRQNLPQGIRLSRGVQFDFTDSPINTLEPEASVIVVRNLAAFTNRYTTAMPIAGQFIGALDNAGETLRLDDATGEKILEFAYLDTWHPITDGLGFSLVAHDPTVAWEDWGHASNWRPGAQPGGSPGAVDPPPPPPLPVVVNELLAHTDPPQFDTVELWNPGPHDADLSGYYLTDDFFTPKKYRLPPGTLLRAGAYHVLTETDFNPAPGAPTSFAFSALGEQVVLFAAKPNSDLVGTYHGFEFGPSPNGVSFSRHLDSQGHEHFVLAGAFTPGTVNAPPRVGPVAITEIMYHPPDLDDAAEAPYEYLELRNLTDSPVPLHHPDHPQHTWKLQQAVTYDFPPEITLPPHGTLLVVGFDPADPASSSAFRTRYQLASAIPLLGPWQGRLDNAGETIDLLQPDTPNPDTVPFILVDRVAYRDRTPWPPAADGLGSSLQRQPIHAFGNDPAHWFASPPTPGADNTVNLPPQITLTSPSPDTTFQRPVDVLLAADANDPDGPVTRVEFFANSLRLGETHTAPFLFNWLNAPAGRHLLIARAHDDRLGFSDSDPVAIDILSQPPEITLTQPEPQALVGIGLDTILAAEASDPDGWMVQVEFRVNGVSVGLALQPPFTLPWNPPHSGPFQLTAIATDDSGATRESPTHTVTAVPAFQQQRILIPAHSIWQVRDNGTAPDPAWTTPAYDAGSWNLGLAELGYGDGDENTVISYGPNSSSKYTTTWFRHPFTVSPSANLTAASLRIVRDDGVIAYLDGIEIFRDNLPDGPILPTTTALAAISGADESTWLTSSIPPALLTTGPHVLCVEMHQVNGTSSDLSFNAELTAVETTFSPVITAIQLNPDGNTLTLQFPAVAGHSYSLQQTVALTIPDWVEAHQIPAANTNRTVTLELEIDTHHTELFRLITPAQP